MAIAIISALCALVGSSTAVAVEVGDHTFRQREALAPASCSGRRFWTQLARKLDDNICRKTGTSGGLPYGIPAFGFIEAVCFSFVRRQKRVQPFDTDYGVYLADGLEIGRGRVQRRREISLYHEYCHELLQTS